MSNDKKKNPIIAISVRRFIEGKYALGFKGDNRGPSLSSKVGYRTCGILFFDLMAGKQLSPVFGSTTGTTYVGVVDGLSPDASAMAKVSTKGSFFIGNENSVSGRIRTAASDPLVPFSPDLDTVLTFKAVITGNILTISGHLQGDTFTGAEVIITYKGGQKFLFTHDSEGSLFSLGNKYLEDLGKFTKEYIIDGDGFIIEELSPLDPRYDNNTSTLFNGGDSGPVIDVYRPPVYEAYESKEESTYLINDALVWSNDVTTIVDDNFLIEVDAVVEPEHINSILDLSASGLIGINAESALTEIDPEEPDSYESGQQSNRITAFTSYRNLSEGGSGAHANLNGIRELQSDSANNGQPLSGSFLDSTPSTNNSGVDGSTASSDAPSSPDYSEDTQGKSNSSDDMFNADDDEPNDCEGDMDADGNMSHGHESGNSIHSSSDEPHAEPEPPSPPEAAPESVGPV